MSKVKTSRLPRRFDATMRTLRRLMDSKSERVRLAAALRASDILLRHQEAEERVTIASERAARKAEAAEGAQSASPVPEVSQGQEEAPDALEAAQQFLESLKKGEVTK